MPRNRIAYSLAYWDFISIKGYPDLPGLELEPVVKHGVDGVAFKEGAFRAEPTPIYLHAIVETLAECQAFIADMKNLQGTQVTLYDATGTAYNGVVITSVRHTGTRYVLKPQWLASSTAAGYRMTFAIIVQYPYGSF